MRWSNRRRPYRAVASLLVLLLTLSYSSGAFAQTAEPSPEPSPSADASPTSDPSPSPDPSPPSPSPEPSPSAAPHTVSLLVKTIGGLSSQQQRNVIARNGGVEVDAIPPLRLHVVEVAEADVDQTIANYQSDSQVQRIERDTTRESQAVPSDPAYDAQWGLRQIGWESVYGVVAPSGNARLAVLDTGVDSSTPDLAGHVVAGFSAIEGASATADANGHGTRLASIAAAATGNGEGIAGVGYSGVDIQPVKVLDDDGLGQDSNIIEGVVWAADHGADVILMAFSNTGFSPDLQDAVDYAWSRGAVLVAAAGNDGSSTVAYPAGDARVIGVSATDESDALWSGSNHGTATFIAAPGVGITVDEPGSGTSSITGTSASAAMVAGAAALLKASDPGASNGVIVGRLARNADTAGTAEQTGNGRLNLARALADTSTTEVVPTGAPGGGPFVGPYVAAAAENLDAWGNISGSWVGTAQGSNSAYREDQSLPVRYSNTFSAGSTHTLILKYDSVDGVEHFIDHLTSVDRSIALTSTQICLGLSGCSGSASATATIPIDTSIPAAATRFTGQQLRAWNVSSISFVGGYGLTGGVKTISVQFTVAGTSGNRDVAIAYGAHLARGNEWGAGNGADSFPGASGKAYTNLDASNSDRNLSVNPNGVFTGAQIQGTVYNDLDGDGVLDAGEPGLGGINLALSGTESTTAISQSDGSYSFSGLTAGTYNVDYTVPTGFVNTGTPRPRTGIVLATETAVSTGNNFFAQQRNGAISGDVVDDLDGDGAFDAGEPGLGSVPVSLFRDSDGSGTLNAGDALVASANTLANGTFAFSGLTAGTYFVQETDPAGYASTAAIAGTGTNTTATVMTSNVIRVVIAALSSPTATASSSGNRFLDHVSNQAPTAQNVTTSTNEDTPITITLTGTDPNGDALTFAIVTGVSNGSTLGSIGTPSCSGTPSTCTATVLYTPGANFNGTDSFTYRVNDGLLNSNTATVTITVNAVNDAPVAVDDSYTTAEDTPLNVAAPGVLGNDTDTEGSALNAVLVAGPSNGSLTLNADGSLSYTPNANFNGTDSFTYRANDGALNSNIATVTITVTAANDAPVAVDDAYTTAEDTPLNVSTPGVLGNDTDADGNSLTAALVSGPSNGSLTLNANGSLSYTPSANFNGTDTFTYRANDGVLNSNVATVTITVTAVNDPPAAVDDSYTTGEDTPLTVAAPGVLANDTDPEGTALSTTLVSGPASGTLTLNPNGSFTYTPNGNFNGTDTFTYRATDGALESNIATVTITVTGANDAPVAVDDSYTTAEDTTLNVSAPGVLGNDTDTENDSLSAILVAGPASGTLTLNSNGSLSYTPNANFNGTDSFTYRANDGALDSNVATVTITVTAVNDAPVAVDDSYTTAEDTTLNVSAPGVLGNDTDTENDSLTAALVAGPSSGTLTLNADGSLSYSPNLNFNGTDSFTYRANDGALDSNIATVTITVTAVNDAPVAVDDSYTTAEDTLLTVAAPGVLGNDTDIENDSLTAALVAGPSSGTLTLNADGSLSYSPNLNFNGTDSFTYRANDGALDSNIATVTLTVTAVNDPPVAVDDSYTTAEDTTLNVAAPGVLGNDTDVENDALTSAVVVGVSSGTLSLNADGSFTYTPNANFNGTDTFTYRANDGALDSNIATVTITVTAVNDAPVANDDAYTTAEDTTLNVAAPGVLGNDTDIENDTLSALLVAGPASGTLTLNSDGSLSYTPNLNFNGTDSFTYRANDGALDSNIATVTITVTAVNDAPVANNDGYTTAEDTTLNPAAAGVLTNDTDIENDALTAAVVAGPANGTLTLNADGSFSYSPDLNFNGTDSFTYRANDGALDSNIATVTITITAVNDAPVANNDAYSTAEDTTLNVPAAGVLTNDTDIENDPLTANLVAGPSSGTLTLNANGSFSYTPNLNFNGTDSFTYRANDGALDSNIATVTITVTAVNDAPVCANQSGSTNEDTTLNASVTCSDVDGDALTYASDSSTSDGSLVFNADGSFTYSPNLDFNGTDSFTFHANDGALDSAPPATFTITVIPVNDAPIANNDAYAGAEDTTLTVTAPGVLGNDTDVDADALNAVLVSGPAHGTLTLNPDGSFSYAPVANYNGPDSFTYRASDGGLNSNVATVSITVNPVNDRPAASNGAATVPAGSLSTSIDLSTLVSDVETANANLTYTLVSQGSKGTAVLVGSNVTYTRNAGTSGTDTFTYRVTDRGDPDTCTPVSISCSAALDSVTATITITIVNGVPTATPGSATLNEDSAGQLITLAGTDPESEPLTFSVATLPAHGALYRGNSTAAADLITAATTLSGDTVTYVPTASYNGPDAFTFTVNDGAQSSSPATVSITVNPINDGPSAAGQSVSTPEDVARTITLAGSDLETSNPDNLTYRITALPTNGTLYVGSTTSGTPITSTGPISGRTVTYLGNLNFNGSDSFTFNVTDRGDPDNCSAAPCSAALTSADALVAITITPVNDTPAIDAGSGNSAAAQYSDQIDSDATTAGAQPVTITPTDVDSTSMTASSQWRYTGSYAGGPAVLTNGLPSGLALAGSSTANGVGSTGSWTLSGRALVPAGVYTVRVTIADPQGGSSFRDVTITVSKEAMTIDYTGLQFLNTSKVGGSLTLAVAARVTEEQDGLLGTRLYSTIPLQLRFILKNISGATIGTCVGNVTQTSAQIAAGEGVATCSFAGLKEGVYQVQVELVDNGFYEAPVIDVAVTISDPGTGFVTGGGWIVDPGQSPSATAGARDNFGFTVKFLKNGNIQGNSLFIYRTVTNLRAIGVLTAPNDTRAYNFIVKSNSLTGLSQTGGSAGRCIPTAPCYALFNGRSNVRAVDRTTGIEYAVDSGVIGNQQNFQVEITDRSEPGSEQTTPPPDSYAIRVWTSAGDFYSAGTVTSSLTAPGTQIPLSGGNIQVHL